MTAERRPARAAAWSSAVAVCWARPGWSGRSRRSRTSSAWTPASSTSSSARRRARCSPAMLACGVSVAGPAGPPARGRASTWGRSPATPWTTRRTPAATGHRGRGSGWARESCCARNALQLRQLPPTAVLSAIVPEGRGSIEAVGALVVTSWPRTRGRRARGSAWSPSTTTPASGWRSAAPRRPGGAAGLGSHGLLRHPGVVPAGAHRRAPLHRRRGVVVDQPRPHGRARASTRSSSSPRRSSFVKDAPRHWRTRVERQWRNRVTLRLPARAGRVHRDGADVTVLGPGEEDLEAFGSNLMDVSRRPRVIETSLRTSAHALRDPAPLPDRTTFEDVG